MSRNKEALAAKAAGLTNFVSSYPCKKCGCVRFSVGSGGKCLDCHAAKAKANYAVNSKIADDAHARYISTDKGRKAKQKAGLKGTLKFARNNPGIVNANTAARRSAKLQRTPAWSDLKAIKEFYDLCPAGYHVDHIIPLQGRLASGLHVLENLQYLPASENCAKGNKFDPSI